MSPIALALTCAIAVGFAAPIHARDSSQQANPAASSDEQGRMHRDTSPAQTNADTSQSAAKPLPQGTNAESTKPAESQMRADPNKSKKKRNPAAQNQAEPVEAPTPSADATADGARGPRGDDDSRKRANMPEHSGPVQKPGEPADPNIKKQQQAR
jgi:hypothetical protein